MCVCAHEGVNVYMIQSDCLCKTSLGLSLRIRFKFQGPPSLTPHFLIIAAEEKFILPVNK